MAKMRAVFGASFLSISFADLFADILANATTSDTPRVPIDREELPLRLSLISQIIKQLAEAGQLKAIRRIANRDGCVNTIASLIGELQRAGKTAKEFLAAVEARADESQVPRSQPDARDLICRSTLIAK